MAWMSDKILSQAAHSNDNQLKDFEPSTTHQFPAAAYKKTRFTKASPSFQLVHRSQRDPLIADENAPRYVLRPTNIAADRIAQTTKESNKPGQADVTFPPELFESDEQLPVGMLELAAAQGFSVESFDPDYAAVDAELEGYTKSGEAPDNSDDDEGAEYVRNLDAEANEHATDTAEDHAQFMLHRFRHDIAANRPPAELPSDDDDDDENADLPVLLPNLQNKADDEPEDQQSEQRKLKPKSAEEDNFLKFELDDEVRSRFTEYSLTSSVIRRNENLKLVDQQFERMYLEEYDDANIGDGPGDDDDGDIDQHDDPSTTNELLQLADQFRRTHVRAKNTHRIVAVDNSLRAAENDSEQNIGTKSSKSKTDAGNYDDDDDENDYQSAEKEKQISITLSEPSNEWDCRSISSALSRRSQQPQIIPLGDSKRKNTKPQPSEKVHNFMQFTRSGLPKEVLPKHLSSRSLKQLSKVANENNNDSVSLHDDEADDDSDSDTIVNSDADDEQKAVAPHPSRNAEETREEKLERKRQVKLQQRERRVEKKANKLAFKVEKSRQERQLAGGAYVNNKSIVVRL